MITKAFIPHADKYHDHKSIHPPKPPMSQQADLQSTMTTIGITGGIGSGKSYVAHLLTTEFAVPVFDCDTEAKRLMTDDPAVRSSLIATFGPAIYLPDGTLNRPLLADLIFRQHHAPAINAIVHPAVRRRFESWREQQQTSAEASPNPNAEASPNPNAEAQPKANPIPDANAEAQPTAEPKAQPSPNAEAQPTANPSPNASAEAKPMALPPAVAIESAILVESGFTDLCDQVWLVTAPESLRIERAMLRDNAPRSSIQARIAAQSPDSALRQHATHIIHNDTTADLLAQIRAAITN